MQVETGNWLGKPDGPQLTLIDTPGTGNTENMDCQYTMDTVKYLKDVVRRIDMFVLLFKGTNPRFDAGMQKQLESEEWNIVKVKVEKNFHPTASIEWSLKALHTLTIFLFGAR